MLDLYGFHVGKYIPYMDDMGLEKNQPIYRIHGMGSYVYTYIDSIKNQRFMYVIYIIPFVPWIRHGLYHK